MGQILHARATTTQRQRAFIQYASESIVMMAHRFGINPKTVAKWRQRDFVHDAKMGAGKPRSSLSAEEQEVVCAFRSKTLLSLDDCFVALKDIIPALSRSNLHRCCQSANIVIFCANILIGGLWPEIGSGRCIAAISKPKSLLDLRNINRVVCAQMMRL